MKFARACAAKELTAEHATFVIPGGSLAAGTAMISAAYTPDSAGEANYQTASGISSAIILIAPGLWVNPIFTSDMVLQEGMPCPVFGTGDAGSTVTVHFLDQTVSAVVGADRRWQVTLSTMPANSDPNTLTVSATGSSTITLARVQVGEVWLFSGQSNMDFPLTQATDGSTYIADAGNHNMRLFQVGGGTNPSSAHWKVSNSTTSGYFSGVGYFTGLELSRQRGIPIGLVEAVHSGTAISTWETSDGETGSDYLMMVKAIQPFAIRGVAWYQGENNGYDTHYEIKLTDMIREWRSDWGYRNLLFGIVQLPYSKWGTAATAQFNVSRQVPNTFLVATLDLYSGDDLHPPDKKPVGVRLAIGVRALAYGENIEYSGPIPAVAPDSHVSGSSVVVNFTHVGNGLVISDGGALGSFEIAGLDGVYEPATAMISGDSVVVTSSVSSPKFVRYGFAGIANLSNSVSIPVEGGSENVTHLPTPFFQLSF